MGHEVVILSTKRPDSTISFYWHDAVLVKPVLEFKQPFPEPYDIPGYAMANNIEAALTHLKEADRLYIHDGEFLFPAVYKDIPTVVSLRDNAYPETMLGSFLFQGDALVTISEYSHKMVSNTVGRLFPELIKRTVMVSPGVNFELFRPRTISPKLKEIIPIDTTKHHIVLHPHRPEESKGLMETVAVVDLLVHRYHLSNTLVLVPHWFDADVSPKVNEYLARVHTEIKKRGLEGNFFFHKWLSPSLMPEYYNLGDVMLALGSFVEAFGNTIYESFACGTPAVMAKVGPYRQFLPDDVLPKVHYRDADTAAQLAAEIIKNKQRTPKEVLAYLKTNYDSRIQLQKHAEVILSVQKLPSLKFQPTEHKEFKLAPWCYIWEDNIYHDFLAKHRVIKDLGELLRVKPSGFSLEDAQTKGITTQVSEWLQEGYIVPVSL